MERGGGSEQKWAHTELKRAEMGSHRAEASGKLVTQPGKKALTLTTTFKNPPTSHNSHPDLQIILYISGSGGLMERMAAAGPDIVSVDHRVDLADAVARIRPGFEKRGAPVAVQGNMDPGVLFGSREAIERRVIETVRAAADAGVGSRHVMNLGHGVLVGTPEDAVAHFFEVGRSVHERM